ncbi:MAG TPA: type II toxin-antitoxin system VapB family antitoxin [Stellaceae bacterium]
MRSVELKEWRKKLGLTQEEAGRRFGVSRVTVQNWESGTSPIPVILASACDDEVRRWRRRPEYGPVILDYGDFSQGSSHDVRGHVGQKVQEKFSHNDAALCRATELHGGLGFQDALIVDESGNIIWDLLGLRAEISRRRAANNRPQGKPGLAERLMEIGRHFSSLPVYDDRSPDEIIGYDENGLPR